MRGRMWDWMHTGMWGVDAPSDPGPFFFAKPLGGLETLILG